MHTQQFQAPVVPAQAPAPYTPYQTGGGIDLNSIVNLMLVMVIMVMMMGMMKEATAKA